MLSYNNRHKTSITQSSPLVRLGVFDLIEMSIEMTIFCGVLPCEWVAGYQRIALLLHYMTHCLY